MRVATDLKFVALAAAVHSTCAVDGGGRAYCWGRNDYGALGNGQMVEGGVGLAPTPVSTTVRFRTVSAAFPVCGISLANVIYCWGMIPGSFDPDIYRQVGDCTTVYYFWYQGKQCLTPTALGGDVRFQVLTRASCGLTSAGAAYCWGDGFYGQLGNGEIGVYAVNPVAVAGNRTYRALTTGGVHSCALAADGQAFCWGLNVRGQLGNGDDGGPGWIPVVRPEPVPVQTTERFAVISAGDHTCAATEARAVWCWGPRFGNLPVLVPLTLPLTMQRRAAASEK